MNILHISRTMGQGGAEKIVYQLCRDNRSDNMFVISCGGIYVDELKKIGVKHFLIPDMDSKNPLNMIKCFFGILIVVCKEHINVIHSHHRMAAFYARIISMLKYNVKRVYTAHNVFFNKKKLLQFALHNSTIIAVGNGVKNNLINLYKVEEKKITLIYNSIETKNIEIKNLNPKLSELKSEGFILIGNIGRISKQKGMDIYLNSMALAIKSNDKLIGIIVGDGEDRLEMEKLSYDLKIEKNIIFLGYQSNIIEIIVQLDFVVLSSLWEGLPLTPIETFSVGKTIIASDIDGNNEIIEDGINGLLFECGNVRELSEKILYLSNNIKIRKLLECNAKETFKNKFSYKEFIKKYKAIYMKLVNGKQYI